MKLASIKCLVASIDNQSHQTKPTRRPAQPDDQLASTFGTLLSSQRSDAHRSESLRIPHEAGLSSCSDMRHRTPFGAVRHLSGVSPSGPAWSRCPLPSPFLPSGRRVLTVRGSRRDRQIAPRRPVTCSFAGTPAVRPQAFSTTASVRRPRRSSANRPCSR